MAWMSEAMTESVTLTPKGTRTNAGAWSYNGTPATVLARVERDTGLRRDKDGREYTFSYALWIPAATAVTLEDRFTIDTIYYYVRDIRTERDVAGTATHKKVWVG